jgi:hypothetical protein
MWATSLDQIEALIFVIREVYGNVIAYVKQQCQKATTQLIAELQGRFPTQDFMDALGIVYHNISCNHNIKKGSMLIW